MSYVWARPCKFHYLFNINEGLALSKLADIVLSLINPGPFMLMLFIEVYFKFWDKRCAIFINEFLKKKSARKYIQKYSFQVYSKVFVYY